jgi:hypothetical protein
MTRKIPRRKLFGDEATNSMWLATEKRVGIISTTPELEPPTDPQRIQALKSLAGQQEAAMAEYGTKAALWIAPDDPEYWDKLHGQVRDRGGFADKTLRKLMGEELQQEQAGRTTRYSDPFWHDRLENLALSMLGIIEKEYKQDHPMVRLHPAPGEILFGTAPGFDINGRSTPVRNSEYYTVLIDETLFAFCFVWGQVLASAHVPNSDGTFNLDRDRRIAYMQENPQIGENALALFRAYLFEGDLRKFPGIPWDQSRARAVKVMVTSMECFLVAHELAHCFQGRSESFVPLPGTERQIESWQREYWADFYGMELAIITLLIKEHWHPSKLISSVLSFFQGLVLLDACVDLLEKRQHDPVKGTETHQSYIYRMSLIRQGVIPVLLKRLFDEEYVKDAEKHAKQSDLLVMDIAASIEAGLIDDIAAGKRAHPLWRD